MKFRVVFGLFLVCISCSISGQPVQNNDAEKCHTDQKMEEMMQDSVFASARESAKTITSNILQNNSAKSGEELYTIPVVFHVIHKGEPEGQGTNISDAQIESAIAALNRDFGATPSDGGIGQSNLPEAAGNTNIEFCLASTNPDGNGTTGINRVDGTNVTQYNSQGIIESNQESIKDLSRWDNRYYLNVWVVSEIDDNGADVTNPEDFQGGTIGYAYFPTYPVTSNSQLDGIVALNLAVGNDPNGSTNYRLTSGLNLNRTLTHEVGHYLDLYHTFEGESCTESNCNTQGDLICDTPPTILNADCFASACSGTQQVENYMDYTGGSCQEMFSQGQKDRMRATLNGVRNDVVNTNNCSSPADYDAGLVILNSLGSSCESGAIIPQVELTNLGNEPITDISFDYQLNSEPSENYTWTGSLTALESEEIQLPSLDPSAGENILAVELNENSLNGSNTDENPSNNNDSWSFTSGGGTQIQFNLVLDEYGSETTWEFENSNGEVAENGGPYLDNSNGTDINETFCLPDDCYTFTIYDSYGDGICCQFGFGSYTIENADNGEQLASGGDFTTSSATEFCLGGTNDECAATSDNCDEFITSISLADYENTTGCDNYDFFGPSVELSEGVEYTITVETQDGTGEYIGYTDDQVAAWIDWNGNGNFTDSGELIFTNTYSETSEYPNTGTFTATANPGAEEFVMRVRMSFLPQDGSITPCGNSVYGEVEDYLIEVVPPEGELILDNTPIDTEISCEADTSDSALGQLTAYTTCPIASTISSTYSDEIINGDCPNEYSIIRSWVVQDECDNIATYQQEITVADNQAPDLICSISEEEISTEGENIAIPDLTDQVSASDNCTGTLNIDQVPTPGTIVPPGNYTLEFSSTDDCGNVGECTIELYVIDTDATLSLESTPADISISCEEDSSPASTGELEASTTCGNESIEVSYEDDVQPGSCQGQYTIIRSWTVEDQCINVATFVQEISVSDEMAPEIDCEGIDMEITTPEEEASVPLFTTAATASDNCTENLVIEQSPPGGTQLPEGVHDILLTTQDDCGNTAECTAELTIESTSGLNEALERNIELFPNPTQDGVEIRLPKGIQGNVKFEVYSASGKRVLSGKSNGKPSFYMDLSAQPPGLYMISIRTELAVALKKVSKL